MPVRIGRRNPPRTEKGWHILHGITRRTMIAAPAAMLAACARTRDPDRLSMWAMSYEGDYAPVLLPSFTARTGIAVDVQTLPWTAAHEKLLTAFAGGALPDVMMLPDGWVGEFAMVGALAPVTDGVLLHDLFPGSVASGRYAGRPYAVPWAVAPQVQFYRRDMLAAIDLAAPPERWDDWRAMARRLKRRFPEGYATLLLLNWWDTLFTFAGQVTDAPLRDRDTRGNFATPAFREALAFYTSLFDEGLAPRVLSTEVPDPVGAFAAGQFAIYPSGPNLLKDLHRRRGEIAPAQWGTARMPGPHGPGAVSSTSSSLTVTTQARRPERAFALIRHLTAPAQELRFQYEIGALPARSSAWAGSRLATDPIMAPFAAQLVQPAAQPAIVEWERIRLEVQQVAERVVRGQIGIDAATREMNVRVDRLLAKRRWLVERGRIA